MCALWGSPILLHTGRGLSLDPLPQPWLHVEVLGSSTGLCASKPSWDGRCGGFEPQVQGCSRLRRVLRTLILEPWFRLQMVVTLSPISLRFGGSQESVGMAGAYSRGWALRGH